MSNNMQDMMRQAQALQKKMEDVQKRLDVTEITGFAGGGNVSFTLSGKMNGRDINIAKEALTACGLSEDAISGNENIGLGRSCSCRIERRAHKSRSARTTRNAISNWRTKYSRINGIANRS